MDALTIRVIIITRGRVSNALKTFFNIIETAKNPEKLKFSFGLKHDDPCLEEYKVRLPSIGTKIHVNSDEKDSVCERVTELALEAQEDLILVMADNKQFRSSYWDVPLNRIFNTYPDKILCAGWRDASQKQTDIITAHCASKELVQALGYFYQPDFYHFGGDLVLQRVCEAIDRFRSFETISVANLHPKYGIREKDATHKKDRTNKIINHDRELMATLPSMVNDGVLRLKGAIEKAKEKG